MKKFTHFIVVFYVNQWDSHAVMVHCKSKWDTAMFLN